MQVSILNTYMIFQLGFAQLYVVVVVIVALIVGALYDMI
jgi:uncharacterized membrane protein YraQ (UPF0718 family)